MKKTVLMVLLFLLSFGVLFADELAKVAVIDMGRIVDAYFQDAKGIKEISNLVSEFKKNKEKFISQISNIDEKRLKAKAEGALLLEKEMMAKKLELERSLKQYHSVMNDKIYKVKVRTQVNNQFEKRLRAIIKQVAIDHGFSIVLEDNTSILWYDKESVDLTDKVIQALAR